jgi:hypothetical protein
LSTRPSMKSRVPNSQDSSFVFPEIMLACTPSRPDTRAYARSSRYAGQGAVGVSGRRGFIVVDERSGAHGQVVWSWRPGAGAKLLVMLRIMRGDRGKNARPWGEHEVSRKAIAQGRPGCLGQTFGNCRLRSLLQAGHGRGQRPVFPASSAYSEGSARLIARTQTRREGDESCR